MKIRIVKCSNKLFWYSGLIGNEYEVADKLNGKLIVLSKERKGMAIYKEDAEVVEDKKSCGTCGSNDCNLCNENHVKWQPIKPTISKTETVEKSCVTCDKVGPCSESLICISNNHNRWVEKQRINKKYLEVNKIEPLLKLIKVTSKTGFTHYINIEHIISITPNDYGTSIATTSNDGDYLATNQIGEVLRMLEYGGKA